MMVRSLAGRRSARALAALIGAITLFPLVVSVPAHALGANLAPNPSFEQSALDPTGAIGTTNPQPLLPTGWAFEGAAGLFDHSQNVSYDGRRSAVISIPLSTNRSVCGPAPVGCNDSPINPAKDATEKYYSVTPYWRTVAAIPVTAGRSYTLSYRTQLTIVTVGEGAVSKVRWVDASGLPIRESAGPSRLQGSHDPPTTAWDLRSGTMTAPSGAKGAIVMLGHSDDLWIGQAAFDVVFFGTTI